MDDDQLVGRILETYSIKYKQILPMQKGYRNRSYPVVAADGRMLNLILYKREQGMLERIKRADAVANYLAGLGYAVRHSADERIVSLRDKTSSKIVRYAELYEYLPGVTIPWEAYTMSHIKLLGKTLGLVHGALKKAPPASRADMPRLPDIRAQSHDLLEEMSAYFDNTDVETAMTDKLGLQTNGAFFLAMRALFAVSLKLPGQQILHMDFVRSNILFDQEPSPNYYFLNFIDEPPFISGILDFEKVAIGPAVFDIARSLAFLLVDCKSKPGYKVRKYFVDSGYIKRGATSIDEREMDLLRPLVRFYLFHDFYKFLRHNPYESLMRNEHFVRTRDILIKDGIIKPIHQTR